MKKVLILEDKEIHRKTLLRILEEIEEPVQVYSTDKIAEAYKISMENTVNLFLVDIILETEEKGDVSGLKFVDSIRKLPQYSFTPVIFITSSEDPKMHAFHELHCYGYIEKPFDKEEVKELIIKALKFPIQENEDRNIYLRTEGIMYSVKVKDIIFIEIGRRKMVVHTVNESITVSYMTSEKMLKELDSSDFVQCSRKNIVNKKYVEQIDFVNRYIKLKDMEEYIEIGSTMKERVKHEFGD